MEWQNPDGSLTRGVIIEDGAGNKITSFAGGGGGGSNASVGANGIAAPSSATEIGFVNALGNLAPVGPSNPLPIAAATALTTSDSGAAITGAAMPSGGSGLTGWLSAIWSLLSGTLAVSLPSSYFDGSGNLKVNVETGGSGGGGSTPTGSAGAPNSAVVTVQGISGGTVVPVADAALAGATGTGSDTAYLGSGTTTIIAALKGLYASLAGTLSVAWSGSPNVTVANASIAITAAALPLPSGAATAASQTNVQSTPGTAQTKALTIQGNSSGIAVPVSGTFWQTTQPVSLASLPALPTGSNLIGAVNLDIAGAAISASNPVPTVETYANISTGQISVASTATLIVAARAGRKEVTIVNNSTTMVYLGGSGVSATTGLLLAGVTGEGITISGGAAVYGIVASGTEPVSYLEVY